MEFGRVEDPTQVDFTLPPDPPGNAGVLSGVPSADFALHLGLTGWREKSWRGDLYPDRLGFKEMLSAYAGSFPAVELNATFYAIPGPEQIQRWTGAVNGPFHFCPKVPRAISHARSPGGQTLLLEELGMALRLFGPHLGEVFMQLPPHLGVSRQQVLVDFCAAWPRDMSLSIEVRDERLLSSPEALACLQAAGMGLVLTDTAGHRELVHMRLLQPRMLIRFVAVGDRGIDDHRLAEWVRRLQVWQQSGIGPVYFFFHEPDNQYAPGLARRFVDQVRRHAPALTPFLPEVKDYGQQQQELFPGS
jgi:uncharacterized protein YecE (DUF72 family)